MKKLKDLYELKLHETLEEASPDVFGNYNDRVHEIEPMGKKVKVKKVKK